MFYYIIFIIIISCFALADLLKKTAWQSKSLYFLLCIFISVFSLTVYQNIASDYINYKYFYDHITPFNDWLNNNGSSISLLYDYEKGYFFLNSIFKIFIENSALFLAIIVLFCVNGILLQLHKITRYIFIAAFIYISHFYFWQGLVLLRQTIAMVFLFGIFPYIYQNKKIKVILLILFSALFHYSVLIFLPFIFIARKKMSSKFMIIIGLICLALGIMNLPEKSLQFFITFIPRGNVFTGYLSATDQGVNIFYIIEMFILLCITLLYRSKMEANNKYFTIALNCLFVGIIISCLFKNFSIGSRLSTLLLFYAYLIIIPNFFNIVISIKYKFFLLLVIIIYFSTFFIRQIAVNSNVYL